MINKAIALGFQAEMESSEKTLGARTSTNNKLNPHMASPPGMKMTENKIKTTPD